MDGMPVSGKELPVIGDEIAGKYRIESVLGQGGMGAVYSARNALTGKRVAIKWLLPEHAASASRERLLREARIACSIEHPNVVDIYDVGEHQGGLFLVMEYLRGQPLSDVLAERGRLDPDELIALIVPAMRGVHAAHQAGVIHRDLKPENIILSESDGEIVPKVVDFGVSKTVGASSVPHSSLTRTGALVGTPHYMALEQVDGSNQIDARTDVYAFGVLLYRALTGYFPFDGSSLGEVILKIGTKDPQAMRSLRPDLPAELDHVILRAMLRAREQRFGDLEEFARALEPFAPGVRFNRETGELRSRSSAGSASRELRQITPSGAVHLEQSQASKGPESSASISGHAAPVRDTPPLPQAPSRARAFWVGAGLAFVALIGLALWLHGRAQEPSVTATPPALPARVEAAPAHAADKAGGLAAAPAEQIAPEPSPPPAAAEPSEAAAAQAAAPLAGEPSPGTPAPEASPGGKPEPEPERAAPSRRSRREARKPAEAHPRGQPSLIPGDRTKGLSSDDF